MPLMPKLQTSASFVQTAPLMTMAVILSPHTSCMGLNGHAQLINSAKIFFSGTDACAWAEVDKINCCYTAPVNPCSICPNGATEGSDDFLPFKGIGLGFICADMVKAANLYETESEMCVVIGSRCCPTFDCGEPCSNPLCRDSCSHSYRLLGK